MKMVIFAKLRQAAAKVLVSLTRKNVAHVSPLSNASAALIILSEHVTVKSVQGDSMMFLESKLSPSAL